MNILGNHTVVVGDWLVDVDITHFNPGYPADMSVDSVDPGEPSDMDFTVLSAAAVRREQGGDMSFLNDVDVEEAIVEQLWH
jgi:hypothetical protein